MPKPRNISSSVGQYFNECKLCDKKFKGDERTIKLQVKLHYKKFHDIDNFNIYMNKFTKEMSNKTKTSKKKHNIEHKKIIKIEIE